MILQQYLGMQTLATVGTLIRIGCVLGGIQMKHYEEHDEGVTLHFDHGQPSVRAKLLVGADGYFSKIRSQCLDDGPPTFVVRHFIHAGNCLLTQHTHTKFCNVTLAVES